jgi:hypothetical protein
MTRDPLTCMLSPECGMRNQNGAATSGNVLALRFYAHPRHAGAVLGLASDVFTGFRALPKGPVSAGQRRRSTSLPDISCWVTTFSTRSTGPGCTFHARGMGITRRAGKSLDLLGGSSRSRR